MTRRPHGSGKKCAIHRRCAESGLLGGGRGGQWPGNSPPSPAVSTTALRSVPRKSTNLSTGSFDETAFSRLTSPARTPGWRAAVTPGEGGERPAGEPRQCLAKWRLVCTGAWSIRAWFTAVPGGPHRLRHSSRGPAPSASFVPGEPHRLPHLSPGARTVWVIRPGGPHRLPHSSRGNRTVCLICPRGTAPSASFMILCIWCCHFAVIAQDQGSQRGRRQAGGAECRTAVTGSRP